MGATAVRLAMYSAKVSTLGIACCLAFGSFGSICVGAGSRVASPPPNPFPPARAEWSRVASPPPMPFSLARAEGSRVASPPPMPFSLAMAAARSAAVWSGAAET